MSLDQLLQRQDLLITRQQALGYLTQSALHRRLRRQWRIVHPGVYLTAGRLPTPRQRLRAALLYGGPLAQLSDTTALAAYGIRYLPADSNVYLLVPATISRANREGVVVRRTHRPTEPTPIGGLPHTPIARAVMEFASRVGDDRTAMAVAADAVQRRLVPAAALIEELSHVTGRGAGVAHRLSEQLVAGVRSAPEADFLTLCRQSQVLPEPLLNPLLELRSGARVSPDALFEDAGLVHETNGRQPHAAEDRFESMQARHGAMTAAGLVVLHSSPRQLRDEPARVVAQVEECYLRTRGSGLPSGVRLLRNVAA
jgi:hypothetical protein